MFKRWETMKKKDKKKIVKKPNYAMVDSFMAIFGFKRVKKKGKKY